MKILYGVQGTGNGHITRARAMARALAEVGVQVDWVFSGRAEKDFNDMEIFGSYRAMRGLTLVIEKGKLNVLRTFRENDFARLLQDVQALDTRPYDLVLNDFEPVTAWAARRAGKKVIGISHQNAFLHDVPKSGMKCLMPWFVRMFAPANQAIGLHWHHFDQPILPPIIESVAYPNNARRGFYLVYLPYLELEFFIPLLHRMQGCEYAIYCNVARPRRDGNVRLLPFSRDGFQRDLYRCEGVLCHAGFELASEAIQLGRKLLVQPVEGQLEQESNALALQQLGFGRVTRVWTEDVIRSWQASPSPRARRYPDVARACAAWLKSGAVNFLDLRDSLWSQLAPVERGRCFDELQLHG